MYRRVPGHRHGRPERPFRWPRSGRDRTQGEVEGEPTEPLVEIPHPPGGSGKIAGEQDEKGNVQDEYGPSRPDPTGGVQGPVKDRGIGPGLGVIPAGPLPGPGPRPRVRG
jgi:hypothetical protein